jgi:hypothetical protein
MLASSLPHPSPGPRFVAALALLTAACSAEPAEPTARTRAPVIAALAGEFNTYIGASTYLQIDQFNQTGTLFLKGDDANLFATTPGGLPGLDPADDTESRNFPGVGASWTDWSNLGTANHQLLDVDNADGRDPTAFPRADSCVGAANVVSKMDLGYVGVASNNAYVYLDVMRRSNLGDAGYVWLFTKLQPPFEASPSCKPEEKLLKFNLSIGDVMVFGHYKTGGGPLLRVFKAKAAGEYDAVGAINFENAALWTESSESIAAVAVNTTITDPGTWGLAGAVKPIKGSLDTELFAEAALTTATFAGGEGSCGKSYYAAVITRSSGSGGTSPDVKDVAGPGKFNFGSVSVTPSATPDCDGKIALAAAVTANGAPAVDPTCTWYEVSGTTETPLEGTACSRTVTGVSGTKTYKVHVTTADGCSTDSATVTAAAWARPTATANLTGSCTPADGAPGKAVMKYEGGAAGVQGTATYAWTFSDGGSSTTKDGSFATAPNVDVTGSFVVTDTRSDGKGGTLVCASQPAKDTDNVRLPLTVSLAAGAKSLVCSSANSALDDAVTFTATAGGGDGVYTYSWTISPADPTASCTAATCKIDPAAEASCVERAIGVSVLSGDARCAEATAGPMTYKKVTSVTVTP